MKRDRHTNPHTTLENCESIKVTIGMTDVICRRDGPSLIRPVGGKRIRDLEPGDLVESDGETVEVTDVRIYR